MRRFLTLCLLLCSTLLAAGLQAADTAGKNPDLEKRQQNLSDIEQQVDQLTRELTERREDRRKLIEELEERERRIAELALSERDIATHVDEQRRIALELAARHTQAQQDLSKKLAVLSELVRTAYIMGRADRLRLLLNQEDPVQASRILSYFAYFNRERLRRIQAVRTQVQRLAELEQNAREEETRLTSLITQHEQSRQELEQAKDARAQVLTQLEATIASRTDDLNELQHDAEALRLLIEHLRQRAQIQAELKIQRKSFADSRGEMAWPLLERRIVAAFGTRKTGSELRWDGVLLAASEGEEVHCIHDGRVVYADWLRGFGLLIVVDHGDGFLSLYGHNEALLKEVGEWVATGDAIALSGNSGGRKDPVLYFAIRSNGKPVDPAQWCSKSARVTHMATSCHDCAAQRNTDAASPSNRG